MRLLHSSIAEENIVHLQHSPTLNVNGGTMATAPEARPDQGRRKPGR